MKLKDLNNLIFVINANYSILSICSLNADTPLKKWEYLFNRHPIVIPTSHKSLKVYLSLFQLKLQNLKDTPLEEGTAIKTIQKLDNNMCAIVNFANSA
jgi:hypothetical protein